MIKSSLGTRLLVSTLLVVSITCILCASVALRIAANWIDRDAAEDAATQSDFVIARIATIDELARARVETAMRTLEDEGRRTGNPAINGEAALQGKTVPDLYLGPESQVLRFDVVDHVKQLAGCTATLFVWDGSNFVRVTTNVLKPNGSRAVGTVLDPAGKAFAALRSGQGFEGVVDILGIPYITSYAPMTDDRGKLVGAWYVGYRLDSIAALGKSIEDARILDHGFVALLKPTGAVVFHGGRISEEKLDELRKHGDGWTIHEEPYPAWGYNVITAYPQSDVMKLELKILTLPAIGTVVMVTVIILLQLIVLRRSVLRPVGQLTKHLATADLNTMLSAERNDEIGALATSFNRYVMRLRQTLLKVRAGSAATNSKSAEIRGISHSAVERMAEQRQWAANAAESVERLSRDIAAISGHTEEASQQARAAADAARTGTQLVTSSVSLIQGLSEDTQQSAESVASLTARAEEIGSIVGVIEEIAAGTNLLALNASIEAARAGEHGRGFAVVAGEVRRLAERTAQATQQVSALVNGIKSETAQTASVIRSACERATQGAETVSSLSSTFDRIAGLVIEVDGRVEKIAEAARQEARAAASVSGSIRQVATSSEESANGAEQVVAATGELLQTANTLEDMVEQFHLIELPQDRAA